MNSYRGINSRRVAVAQGGRQGEKWGVLLSEVCRISPCERWCLLPARSVGSGPPAGGGLMSSSEAMPDRQIGSLRRSIVAETRSGTDVGRRPELVIELLSQIEPCAKPWSFPTDMAGYCSRVAKALVATRIGQAQIPLRDSETLLQLYSHGILDGLYGVPGIVPHLDGLPEYLRCSASEAATIGQIHGTIIRRCWEARQIECGSP